MAAETPGWANHSSDHFHIRSPAGRALQKVSPAFRNSLTESRGCNSWIESQMSPVEPAGIGKLLLEPLCRVPFLLEYWKNRNPNVASV
jgi:hypothetical protein